jgi:hypothetical protein
LEPAGRQRYASWLAGSYFGGFTCNLARSFS